MSDKSQQPTRKSLLGELEKLSSDLAYDWKASVNRKNKIHAPSFRLPNVTILPWQIPEKIKLARLFRNLPELR